jgi:integrase
MKAHLIRRAKHYAVKFYNPETRKWSHRSLKTTKKAIADLRFGQFLEERHKKELLGELKVEPVSLQVLAKEFLEYVEANRSEKYARLVKQYTEKWLSAFGSETLTTAITARMIQRYAIARKKDKCKIKGTPLANATVNRDLAALKHMLHKAEIWGYVEISPGRRVENLRDDGSVRTDYYTEEQLKLLVSTAVETRGAHPLNFNDWPEFIVLDANTGLRCKEMLFLEFSDIDWNAGVLHVRNKTQVGFRPKGRKERRIPLNVPAMYALRSMFQKKHAESEYVFHQGDGFPWKSILESFRSLLKRCGFKRSGVHILRHTFGAHLAQKGVDMAVIRDLLGHHSVTLTEKYYAHLAPSSLTSAVQRLHNKENLLPKLLPKTDFAPFSGTKNGEGEVPLTDSFERCYVPEVALLAGVAKLAYAADSKSLANGDSTTSKTCRNLSKTSFKPRTGAGFSPIYRARMGESYRKFIGDK